MSIGDLRTEFKSLSGLISASDVECDKWINRGIRHLDLLANFPFSQARQAQLITVGQYMAQFQSLCRVIHNIWIVDLQGMIDPSTGLKAQTGRTRLNFYVMRDKFHEVHPDIPNEILGTPIDVSLAVIKGVDSYSVLGGLPSYDKYVESIHMGATIADGSVAADGTTIADFLITGDTRGVIFGPPADHEYMLEIYGKWYSVALTDLVPDNNWSIFFPETVLAAALYKLNLIKYRNSEGAKDFATEISLTLQGLDYDRAEEDSVQITKMEG